MRVEMKIFENKDYKYISDFIESKSYILGNNKEFSKYYMNLSKLIEELDNSLEGEQKEKFNEIIKLFYKTEEYYFAFSYSLGIKYGEDLKKSKVFLCFWGRTQKTLMLLGPDSKNTKNSKTLMIRNGKNH